MENSQQKFKDMIVLPLHVNDYNVLLDLLNKVPSNNKQEAYVLIQIDNVLRQVVQPLDKFVATHAPEPIPVTPQEDNGKSKNSKSGNSL